MFRVPVLVAGISALATYKLYPEATGQCSFQMSRLRCTPVAVCALEWDGWHASCQTVPLKMPAGHPPVPAGAKTFCGFALDADSWWPVRVDQWGINEWGMAIGLLNWCLVGLLYVYDSCRPRPLRDKERSS